MGKLIMWVEHGIEDEHYKVGEEGVVNIEEHKSEGDGDRWFYDVHYADGKIIRTFYPSRVCFTNEPEEPKLDIPF